MQRLFCLLLFTSLYCLSGPAFGQAGYAAAPLKPEQRDKLIIEVSEKLTEIYVFPEVAQTMVELINRKNSQGEYDRFISVEDFAEQLTTDLQSISHDRHLHVNAAPAPKNDGADRQLLEDQINARVEAHARESNYGFKRLEILPGNIGYVDLRMFYSASVGGPTAIAAMNFLSNSSALIFDLRHNGGGDPSMIQLISSYLFEEPQHLNSFYVRRSDSLEQYWTQASVPGPKMVHTPVYILTSARTFSAAEEFTYDLKTMERATVVGETTGGGAHPVELYLSDLGEGQFASMSIPFGRAINPITGTNWEGTGVAPDIDVNAEDALDIAQLAILEKLIDTALEKESVFALEWARDELDFRMQPPKPVYEVAPAFVGNYGPRRVSFDDGKLYYQRGDGQPHELLPMKTADRFHVGNMDDFRIQFVRGSNGEVVELIGQYASGEEDSNSRNGR